jgi:hypothetical protein
VFAATYRGRSRSFVFGAFVLTVVSLRATLRVMNTQRKAQDEGPERNLNFRAPIALHDRFREVAEADHRTVSQELRRLMEQRIAEADERLAA